MARAYDMNRSKKVGYPKGRPRTVEDRLARSIAASRASKPKPHEERLANRLRAAAGRHWEQI